MQVIAKRTIMFYDEAQVIAGSRSARKHIVQFSKDIQEIPDWIGEQSAFKTATQDGTIAVIQVQAPVRVAPVAKFADGPVVELEKMNKAELQTHAREVHNLDLDDKLKKDEMIAAIKEKAAK